MESDWDDECRDICLGLSTQSGPRVQTGRGSVLQCLPADDPSSLAAATPTTQKGRGGDVGERRLGLGTPRETIRLVNASGDLEDWGNTTLLGTKSGNNYTSMMAAYTASKFEALDNAGTNGYILKALSPSCGLRGIPVYPTVGTKGRGSGKAQAGMFAKALMELWPELPVEDEGRLADVSLRQRR